MDEKILTSEEKSVKGFAGDVKYHLGTSYKKFYEK